MLCDDLPPLLIPATHGELPPLLSVSVELLVLSLGGSPDGGRLWSTLIQHSDAALVVAAQLSAPSTSDSGELPPLLISAPHGELPPLLSVLVRLPLLSVGGGPEWGS